MNGATLSSLVEQSKQLADMRGAKNIDATQLKLSINNGLSELHDLFVNAMQEYKVARTNIPVTKASSTYALPGDFYKLRKAFLSVEARRYKLRKFNLDQIDGVPTTPVTSGVVELWYVRTFKPLVDDGDSVDPDVPNGFERYAALYAAIDLVGPNGLNLGHLIQDRDRLKERIANMVEPRDEGEPDQISDVYNRFSPRWMPRQTFPTTRYLYRVVDNELHVLEYNGEV